MNGDLLAELRWSEAWVVLGYLTLLATFTGFASRFWWVFELASHFRIQYFVILVVLTFALAAAGRYETSLIFLLGSTLNLLVIAPFYLRSRDASVEGTRLGVMSLNVQRSNDNYAEVENCIERHSPDLVVFQEVNQKWLGELSALNRRYPYGIQEPRNNNFGIALFSKFPLVSAEIVYLSDPRFPSILAQLEFDHKRIAILGTHPPPPTSATYAKLRNNQLAAIPRARQKATGPLIVLGDLNISPWSHHFMRMRKKAGLHSAARGYGVLPTWPAKLFPIGIPIDHCLHSDDVKVVDFKVGKRVGSDHLPILVDLLI